MTMECPMKDGNKLNDKDKYILHLYLIAEGVLFVLIIWAETVMPYSVTGRIMYSAILLNFLIIARFYIRYRGDYRIPLALTVTLAADFFLTYLNNYYKTGVCCFILVQLIYAWVTMTDHRAAQVIFRILCIAVYFLLTRMSGMPPDTGILCACSMGILTGNVVFSWKNADRRGWFLFALGLTLFAGCDLSLGLRDATASSESMYLFHMVMYYATWIFYVPSQVLLVLSYIGRETGDGSVPSLL